MKPRAEQIGELQPITLKATHTSAELRELLEAHETQRPDHLKCTHPDAPLALRQMWSDWCDRKAHLKTQLTMALAAEENRWVDAAGNPVTPAPWKSEPTTYVMEQRIKAEEMKSIREAKKSAAERGRMGGRPRVENPSKETLRGRARYAAKKVEAA